MRISLSTQTMSERITAVRREKRLSVFAWLLCLVLILASVSPREALAGNDPAGNDPALAEGTFPGTDSPEMPAEDG